MSTSGRLLALLSLLQARRDWPGGVLAARLDVSARTVRRDVDRLRDLGYPITATKGPDGGYRLAAGNDLPPLLFDDEQAVAVAVALQLCSANSSSIADAAARALTTVRQVMPARLRKRIDAVRVTPVSRPVAHSAVDAAVLTAVIEACNAKEVLRFDYRSSSNGADRPPRRVEPHHVIFWQETWYLAAWDLERDDWRTYRLDRMNPRAPTGPRFTSREVPGGDVGTFVIGRFRGARDGSTQWPCMGEVILALDARDVAPYTPDGIVQEMGPGRCRLVLGAWSWAGLAATIGRLDGELESVSPHQLREAFDTLSHRFARAAGVHRPGNGTCTFRNDDVS